MVLESTSHSVARSCVVIHGEREIDIQMKASPTPGNATGERSKTAQIASPTHTSNSPTSSLLNIHGDRNPISRM